MLMHHERTVHFLFEHSLFVVVGHNYHSSLLSAKSMGTGHTVLCPFYRCTFPTTTTHAFVLLFIPVVDLKRMVWYFEVKPFNAQPTTGMVLLRCDCFSVRSDE
ncbi:hypothetical protein VCUG_02365 [Vavraia culicis subsp. floridensis]|uniref:Uncharacterized protein n=1 Tax=Vavraia culicis (isolate floridensis) TaxID=948595 RepID=L2GSQ7_VAVCU|nr:uncharacterized protein VCUG_02365 [Vavraia culicis subsp. floridensis]ELA46130.1 hypothetical protein VCUG_02365 [Vavraia culicis subsp. floridensis]